MAFFLEITGTDVWQAITGAGIPLLALWATFFIFNRQLEEGGKANLDAIQRTFQEEKQRQDLFAEKNLIHFVWLLEDVVKFATKQTGDYLVTAAAIIEAPMLQHPFVIRASGILSRILAIKQDDIFFSLIHKALDTPDNRRHIALIYNKLDFIASSIKDAKLDYYSHLKTYNKIGGQYREIIEEIRDLISAVIYKAEIEAIPTTDTLYDFFKSVQKYYVVTLETFPDASKLAWHQSKYLTPLMNDMLDNHRGDERTYPILTKGRRANVLVGRIKHSSQDAADSLHQSNSSITKTLSELKKEIDFIKAVLQRV